jgi:hypothetical protein
LIVSGITPYFDRFRRPVHCARAVGVIFWSFVGLLLAGADVLRIFRGLFLATSARLAIAAFAAVLFKIETIWVVLAGTVIAVFFF